MAKKIYLIVTVDQYDLVSYWNNERPALLLSKKYLISYKQGTTPKSTNLLEQMKQDGFEIDPRYFNNFVSNDLNEFYAQLPENFSIKINEIEKVKGK